MPTAISYWPRFYGTPIFYHWSTGVMSPLLFSLRRIWICKWRCLLKMNVLSKPNWKTGTIAKAQRAGADAIKLLAYYHSRCFWSKPWKHQQGNLWNTCWRTHVEKTGHPLSAWALWVSAFWRKRQKKPWVFAKQKNRILVIRSGPKNLRDPIL